jgi:hypothetical protein
MGAMLEVVTGFVASAGGVFTACTPATGDSFNVRNFLAPDTAYLLDAWALGATAGTARVRSPRLHDNVQGIRAKFLASTPQPFLPDWARQVLYAQDTLILEINDAGAETDILTIINYYTNLPGSNQQLFDWPTIEPRIRNILTNEVSLLSGASLGTYSGSVAVNSSFDLLKANTWYAILGYVTDTSVATIGIRGPDTSNFRVGGPGTNLRVETRDWFVRLAGVQGLPLIPVFNSANKAGTLVDVVHNTNAITTVCELILAELAS